MRILLSALVFCTLMMAAGVVGVMYVNHQVSQPLNLSSAQFYTVANGSNAYKVAQSLREASLSNLPPLVTKVWLKVLAPNTAIKSGTYQLLPGQSFKQVIETLYRGEEYYFSVSLVEGLTLKQWIDTLKAQPRLVDDINKETIPTLLKELPWRIDRESGEGLLLADTYFFTAGTPASEILKRAFNTMMEYLNEQWQNRQIGLPLKTPYEALILASIIEKETAVAQERAKIAGVFINRLRKNMRLQTDPTVIYGLGDLFDGDITRTHLRTPTPYNTYTIKGLPPTPIAMAGRDAIVAALHPMQTDALYFVARGDGTHEFSSSLEAHNAAVRKYQLNLN